jgi:hypothetical protein
LEYDFVGVADSCKLEQKFVYHKLSPLMGLLHKEKQTEDKKVNVSDFNTRPSTFGHQVMI